MYNILIEFISHAFLNLIHTLLQFVGTITFSARNGCSVKCSALRMEVADCSEASLIAYDTTRFQTAEYHKLNCIAKPKRGC
jgi:hypothetical protein